jgi:hypothetical protein
MAVQDYLRLANLLRQCASLIERKEFHATMIERAITELQEYNAQNQSVPTTTRNNVNAVTAHETPIPIASRPQNVLPAPAKDPGSIPSTLQSRTQSLGPVTPAEANIKANSLPSQNDYSSNPKMPSIQPGDNPHSTSRNSFSENVSSRWKNSGGNNASDRSVVSTTSTKDATSPSKRNVKPGKPPFLQHPQHASLVVNGWVEQYRRSKFRGVWKEVLMSVAATGVRPSEEMPSQNVNNRKSRKDYIIWIQREVQNSISGKRELEVLHRIPIQWLQQTLYIENSGEYRFSIHQFNQQEELLFRCPDVESAQSWVMTLRSILDSWKEQQRQVAQSAVAATASMTAPKPNVTSIIPTPVTTMNDSSAATQAKTVTTDMSNPAVSTKVTSLGAQVSKNEVQPESTEGNVLKTAVDDPECKSIQSQPTPNMNPVSTLVAPLPLSNQSPKSSPHRGPNLVQPFDIMNEDENQPSRMTVKEMRAVAHGAGLNTIGMERSDLERAVAGIIGPGFLSNPTSAPKPERPKSDPKWMEELHRQEQQQSAMHYRTNSESDVFNADFKEIESKSKETPLEEKHQEAITEENGHPVQDHLRFFEETKNNTVSTEAQRRWYAEQEKLRQEEEKRQQAQSAYEQHQKWQAHQQWQAQQAAIAQQHAAQVAQWQQWMHQQQQGHPRISQPAATPHQQSPQPLNPFLTQERYNHQPETPVSSMDSKYIKMATEPGDEAPTIHAIKCAVLKNWALQPPNLLHLRSISDLLTTIHLVFPPAFGVPSHDHFAKWTPISHFDLVTEDAKFDQEKLNKALKKLRFFLHPDRLPKDLTDEHNFMCKMLWDISSDAWEEFKRRHEELDWIEK